MIKDACTNNLKTESLQECTKSGNGIKCKKSLAAHDGLRYDTKMQ